MKILITGGATREPIDSVRFITNMSSGRTAARLADYFAGKGHSVVLLAGEGAVTPARHCELVRYTQFSDLAAKMKSLLSDGTFDLVIHSAAVSDFSVSSVTDSDGRALATGGKLVSGGGLVIRMSPNPKLLSQITEFAAGAGTRVPQVVGFKLTNTPDLRAREEAIAQVLSAPGVSLVVHNDLSEIQEGRHVFTLVTAAGSRRSVEGADALGMALEEYFK